MERGAPLPNLLVHAPKLWGMVCAAYATVHPPVRPSAPLRAQGSLKFQTVFGNQKFSTSSSSPNKDPSRFQEEEEEEQNETKNALREFVVA